MVEEGGTGQRERGQWAVHFTCPQSVKILFVGLTILGTLSEVWLWLAGLLS